MTKAQQQAQEFVEKCRLYGFTWEVRGSIVTISQFFKPEDGNAYVHCDMMGPSVLDYAPLKGGSVWGSDGGGIGGMVALTKGHYVLNKSGTGANFLKALRQL